MMTGLPPFYNENLNILYERILNAPIPLPRWLTKEARSIFLGLLERNPKKRLGSSQKDASEIIDHPFFKSMNFRKLKEKGIKPPFIPKQETTEEHLPEDQPDIAIDPYYDEIPTEYIPRRSVLGEEYDIH